MSETSNASFTPGRLRQSRGSPVRSSRFSLDRLAAAERVPDIRLDAIEAGDAGPEKVDNAVLEWLVTAGLAGPIEPKALDRRDAPRARRSSSRRDESHLSAWSSRGRSCLGFIMGSDEECRFCRCRCGLPGCRCGILRHTTLRDRRRNMTNDTADDSGRLRTERLEQSNKGSNSPIQL